MKVDLKSQVSSVLPWLNVALLLLPIISIFTFTFISQAHASPPKEGRLRMATFNVDNLSERNDVSLRAAVMSEFDIIALQEVETIAGLTKIVKELERTTKSNWSQVLSPQSGKGNHGEYFAFVYRPAVVEYIEETASLYDGEFAKKFVRPPFYAGFRASKFDFTLITVHIKWSKSSTARAAETRRLADVYNHVQESDAIENDVILLGDFNLWPWHERGFQPMREAGLFPVLSDKNVFTTYGAKERNQWSNFYDNIWLSTATSEWISGAAGVVPTFRMLKKQGMTAHMQARRLISDHCPVWAVFSTVDDDDYIKTKPEQKFIGNDVSMFLHRPGCRYLPSKKRRVALTDRDAAIESGFKPCRLCKP